MNVVNLPCTKDKLQSAAEALNMAESGRIWLPGSGVEPGFPLEEVQSQLLRFTGDDSGHDDIWDTFGIAGTVAELRNTGSPGLVPVVYPT